MVVQSALITNGITVTFMFHSYLRSLARSKSLFSLLLSFYSIENIYIYIYIYIYIIYIYIYIYIYKATWFNEKKHSKKNRCMNNIKFILSCKWGILSPCLHQAFLVSRSCLAALSLLRGACVTRKNECRWDQSFFVTATSYSLLVLALIIKWPHVKYDLFWTRINPNI